MSFRNERHHEVCKRRVADGRCYRCGDMRSARSVVYCDRCLARANESARRYQAKKKAPPAAPAKEVPRG